MNAKFDVDEKVNITGKVVEINATDDGIVYQLKVKTVKQYKHIHMILANWNC